MESVSGNLARAPKAPHKKFSYQKVVLVCFAPLAQKSYRATEIAAVEGLCIKARNTFVEQAIKSQLRSSDCLDIAMSYLAMEKIGKISAQQRQTQIAGLTQAYPEHKIDFYEGAFIASDGLECHNSYGLLWSATKRAAFGAKSTDFCNQTLLHCLKKAAVSTPQKCQLRKRLGLKNPIPVQIWGAFQQLHDWVFKKTRTIPEEIKTIFPR